MKKFHWKSKVRFSKFVKLEPKVRNFFESLIINVTFNFPKFKSEYKDQENDFLFEEKPCGGAP